MDEDSIDEDQSPLSITSDDVESAVDDLLSKPMFKDWQSAQTLNLAGKNWRPHAVSADGSEVLHVSLQGPIPRFVIDRLQRAAAKDVKGVVALSVATLYQPEVVTELAAIDTEVLVLDDYREERRLTRRHILAAVADIEVPIAPDRRQQIGEDVWSRISQGTAHQKGRRLEALLAFLFSQIDDLRVVERNFRGASDEVDLVLQVDNHSNRAWQQAGVPFILVEAKNRIDKATQQDVSALISKLQTKRGSAKFGLMVAVAGFTQDATLQELKFAASHDICVPMIDGDALAKLIAAPDLDKLLEEIVRAALLR